MPAPRTRRGFARFLPWILCLAACGADEPATLDEARSDLQRGELDRASAALDGASGPEAEQLRTALRSAREHREALETSLAKLSLDAPSHDARWLRIECLRLETAETDPVNVARIEAVQQGLDARRAT